MKRQPRTGELELAHTTAQTGDTQVFAVCHENYNPALIETVKVMRHAPLLGYKISEGFRETGRIRFSVLREDGTVLTENEVSRSGQRIFLLTTLAYPMPPDEAMMVADLEQCAALMLLADYDDFGA